MYKDKMKNGPALRGRKGATRMGSVPTAVLRELSKGSIETVNLMEWLAADMGKLARTVADETSIPG